MTLGIFTDSHYSSQLLTCERRYNSQSLRKIKEAYEYFDRNQCDLVICLGDLIDKESDHSLEIANLNAIASVFRAFSMKTIVVMGNHDAFSFCEAEFYQIVGESCRPRTVSQGKTHLVFLDACHFRSGKHYQPGDWDWTDTYYPPMERLEQELKELQGEIYLFLHQNVDSEIPQNHCLYNAKELRRIIEAAGTVKAVFQGHYHPGKESSDNGIVYKTFPAMCENEDAYFIVNI